MNVSIWIALAASLAGCVVSACHVALRTFSRKRLADLLEDRGKPGRYDKLIKYEHLLVLTTGALRAIFTVVITLACYRAFTPYLDEGGWRWLAGFGSALALLLVFCLGIPVSWGKHRPERLLAWASPGLILLSRLMMPLVQPLHWLDPVVRRISGVDIDDDEDDVADEVLSAIEEHDEGKNVGEAQREMLEAVLELPKTFAGEVMTPRTDVKGIEYHSSLAQVKDDVLSYGYSRIPVYEENLDNIKGILYAKDLIRYLGDGVDFQLEDVIREAFLVPETKPVSDLLAEFKQKKSTSPSSSTNTAAPLDWSPSRTSSKRSSATSTTSTRSPTTPPRCTTSTSSPPSPMPACTSTTSTTRSTSNCPRRRTTKPSAGSSSPPSATCPRRRELRLREPPRHRDGSREDQGPQGPNRKARTREHPRKPGRSRTT